MRTIGPKLAGPELPRSKRSHELPGDLAGWPGHPASAWATGRPGVPASPPRAWPASPRATETPTADRSSAPSGLLPSPYERPPPSPDATEPAPTEIDTASMVVQDDDPDLAGDLVVIDDFLAKDPLWSRRPGVDPLVLDIATFSSEWVLARTDSGYTIENRRSRNVSGTFSSARGARRYAIMELGRLWRPSHGLKSIWPKHPAPAAGC